MSFPCSSLFDSQRRVGGNLLSPYVTRMSPSWGDSQCSWERGLGQDISLLFHMAAGGGGSAAVLEKFQGFDGDFMGGK